MQQSNTYIVLYTAALTTICGILLAVTAVGLKPKQDENIALEQKKNILSTVMELKEGDNITEIYGKRVKGYVVDFEGDKKEGMSPSDISVAKEYKKDTAQRLLPVYEILSESNPEQSEYYVLPLYGFGLWNNIAGYVALKGDLNTVKGVKFEHVGETPGLGARIATDEVQERYAGKKMFDGATLKSVMMLKGENGGGKASIEFAKDKPYEVDGMSGATITGKGLNNMMQAYLRCYENFIKAKQKGS